MTPPERPPIKVLIVDDDEDTTTLLCVLLGRQGWLTTFALNLEQARGALAIGDISALVTDVSLPDGSGLSLLASGRPPSLRAAVVITGRGDDEERRQSTQNGFDACLAKPFNGVALVGLLAKLLAPNEPTVTPTGA